jgi:cholesterol transport system auxiliary component
MRFALTLPVLAFTMTCGCALTSRGKASEWSWFTPERVRPHLTSAPLGAGPAVRIRRVTSGTDLGRRIVFGDGAYEVGYYEQRRWTEGPDLYVRRALERTLCQEQGFRCDLDGSAATLDIEVLKFQEVKTARSHAALVSLRVVLSNDRVLLDDTVQVDDRVLGSSFDEVVAAMARALDGASDEVARRVSAALAKASSR